MICLYLKLNYYINHLNFYSYFLCSFHSVLFSFGWTVGIKSESKILEYFSSATSSSQKRMPESKRAGSMYSGFLNLLLTTKISADSDLELSGFVTSTVSNNPSRTLMILEKFSDLNYTLKLTPNVVM
jgi:hypothetical protein